MAAPPSKTVKDINGKWVMNKKLSHDPVSILKFQGVGMILRNTIGYATITLDIKQFEEGGATHINVSQTATGGVQGTTEKRILDFEERGHSDFIFGDVVGRSKWTKLDALEDGYGKEDADFLTKDWEPADEYVLSWVRNDQAGWTATQIWGFQEINGERRYARNVVVKNATEKIEAKLYYDYISG